MMVNHKISSKFASQKGFSVVELMVAMVIAGIVLSGVFAFSSVQKSLATEHHRELRVEQILDGAMWSLSRDVRMAGLGVTRICTELRVWDGGGNRLLNPGSIQDSTNLAAVPVDPITREPFWVLRDGFQAHWRSNNASDFAGSFNMSAEPESAADSFDVILGDGNFTSASGVFNVDVSGWGTLASGASTELLVSSATGTEQAVVDGAPSSALDAADNEHLAQVQQIFPPGSFVMIARIGNEEDAFRPHTQRQCSLLQVTGNVKAGPTSNTWLVPITNESDFNANLTELLGLSGATAMTQQKTVASGGTGDWTPDTFAAPTLIPLGNFRWSRYEVDYSIENSPHLVRNDIIGWTPGGPTIDTAGVAYPGCESDECPMPTLRLAKERTELDAPPRVSVGPMVEDMQVSVGCDGYTQAGVNSITETARIIPMPDVGFEEKGAKTGGGAAVPNSLVDEWDLAGDRKNDEWLGNALEEQWAPDCVFYGTGQTYAAQWMATALPSENGVGPGFRMSPQVVRITLMARIDMAARGMGSGHGSSTNYMARSIEDRPEIAAFVPNRSAYFRSEKFTPRNLRWRDPSIE